jgi:hypothetical protein
MALKISILSVKPPDVRSWLGPSGPGSIHDELSGDNCCSADAKLCRGEARQQVGGARQAKSFRRPTGARADDNISRPDRRSLDGCRPRPVFPIRVSIDA